MASRLTRLTPETLHWCFGGVIFWMALVVSGLPDVVRVGGIFESGSHKAQLSFRYAIDQINKDISILPRTELMPIIHEVKQKDSFTASKALCTFFKQRVSAIIGPTSEAVTSFTKSACTNLNVPHLQTSWEPKSNRNPYTLNLFPDPEVFGKAYLDLIINKKWKSFTVLYEHQDSEDLRCIKKCSQFTNIALWTG